MKLNIYTFININDKEDKRLIKAKDEMDAWKVLKGEVKNVINYLRLLEKKPYVPNHSV